jgi:hypothetical protein
MKVFEQLIADNSKHIPAIEQALRETYFSGYDQQFLLTDNGRNDIENNVFRRYNHSLRHVVPWLGRVIDLAGKNVLEIGCGTGSSTAALGGDYGDFLVAGGFEPEILDWFPCTIEEELLRWYVQHKNFAIPLGFTRCVLNLIFRKPSGTGAPPIGAAPAAPPPLAHFNPDVDGRVTSLERQLREKEDLIGEIYRSATWRAGSLIAAPWRIVRRLFKM